jgi:hypothetical protein
VRKTLALLLVLSLVGAVGCGDDETSSSPRSTTTVSSANRPRRSVLDAVETWVVDHRDTVFSGFDGKFAGACEEGVLNVLCAIPRENLGVRAIVSVGVASSDWGVDVLLQRGDQGWMAVDDWKWNLDSAELGPPFSPMTAIAKWWVTTDPTAVFVRACEEIDTAVTDQKLVCAKLESGSDEVRRYRTGPPPSVDAHQVEVRYQQDHSWVVADG